MNICCVGWKFVAVALTNGAGNCVLHNYALWIFCTQFFSWKSPASQDIRNVILCFMEVASAVQHLLLPGYWDF